MEFRTVVDVAQAEWRIEPFDRLLLVGSCFAQNMGLKFEGSPDKPGGLSIQLCKSEKKEFYIRYSS